MLWMRGRVFEVPTAPIRLAKGHSSQCFRFLLVKWQMEIAWSTLECLPAQWAVLYMGIRVLNRADNADYLST
jgi:hypothetical protein